MGQIQAGEIHWYGRWNADGSISIVAYKCEGTGTELKEFLGIPVMAWTRFDGEIDWGACPRIPAENIAPHEPENSGADKEGGKRS